MEGVKIFKYLAYFKYFFVTYRVYGNPTIQSNKGPFEDLRNNFTF